MKTSLFAVFVVASMLLGCEIVDENVGQTAPSSGNAGAAGMAGTSSNAGSGGNSGAANAAGIAGQAGNAGAGSFAGTAGTGSGGSSGSSASGGTSGTAGTGGFAGQAGCAPQIVVELNKHFDTEVCPGTNSVESLVVTLTAQCQDMEVKKMDFKLVALDLAEDSTYPFCKASCVATSDWFFHNAKLMDGAATIRGPIELKDYAMNDHAHLRFTDSFSLATDKPVNLTVRMDVSDQFYTSLNTTRIKTQFIGIDVGDGNIPVVVKNNVDPQTALKIKSGCAQSTLGADVYDWGETAKPSILVPGIGYPGEGIVSVAIFPSKGSQPFQLTGATVCQIDPDGDVADFNAVTISWAAKEIVSATQAVDNCWTLTRVKDGSDPDAGLMSLNVQVAVPQSSATVNGAWHGVPRSGHTPQVKLMDITISSLDGTQTKVVPVSNVQSNRHVLRASRISLLQSDIPQVPLQNGGETIVHRVLVQNTNAASLKHLEITAIKSGAFTLDTFRVYRTDVFFNNPVDITDKLQLKVWVDTAHGVMSAVPADAQSANIYLGFNQEEMYTGTSSTGYTITAVPHGVTSGNWLNTVYWKSNNSLIFTAQLGQFISGQYTLYDGFGYSIGTVLWSDLSELPHNDQNQGSKDWMNDMLVRFGSTSLNPATKLFAP